MSPTPVTSSECQDENDPESCNAGVSEFTDEETKVYVGAARRSELTESKSPRLVTSTRPALLPVMCTLPARQEGKEA